MPKSEDQILWEKKIAGLSEIPVYLAEFEYLYDSDPKLRGQIDPNALSAGGFPFLFRKVLECLYDSIDQEQGFGFKDKGIYTQQLSDLLTREFCFGINDSSRIALLSFNTLEKMMLGQITDEEVQNYINAVKGLKARLSSNYTLNPALFEKLLTNENGISFVLSQLWETHKVRLFENFLEKVNSGNDIGHYKNELLHKVLNYIEHYVDIIFTNSNKVSEEKIFNIFAVEWESDLSYAAKCLLERGHADLKVSVYLDLHSDTGILSKIPLYSVIAPLGNEKKKKTYELLIKKETLIDGVIHIVKPKSAQFPRIEINLERNEEAILSFTAESSVPLEGLVTFNRVDVDDFDQYAYQFKHVQRNDLDLSNPSYKKMFLSSLLNAKAALFWIYAKSEVKIEHPPTLIDPRGKRSAQYKNFVNGGLVVIKEGGFCSTGGSEVKIIKEEGLKGNSDFGYITNVVQPYIPSHLFQYNGKDLHTHIRKASVINSKGEVAHCGYVMKACYENQTNSSAFKTIVLTFDENKEFINGTFISGKSANFKSLEEVGITHTLDKREFEELLDEVKLNWLKAMFVLNDYCAGDIKEKFNNMVEQGIISSAYKLI